ncbi:endo-1,4-beta-glucanase [Aspergillus taichungensis]|uniref:AA9 family lytic polysaccharide monooxygenase n=1 Tax=Aspergillus taichungensis TaxID=482145 RepID=A0A2J5HEI7_9EURO|nr:endo-1,4-beta-glucanase [Aspergillus taichungensis]
MHPKQKAALLATLLSASKVAAHGHISNIVINGVSYSGWDIGSDPYNPDPPVRIAWQTPNTANGFVSPDAYATDDIICHLDATNARGHAVVAAGDKISLQWTPWPESHHGPMLDYLARCDGSCETVDKTTLKFFKIDGVGLVDPEPAPGVWGADQMIANNNSWMVQIPPTIAPGNYVLRHETIALHSAGSENGAQNYMQCFNLEITGSGTAKPEGVPGKELYKATDPGILVNIYQSLDYVVPGPSVIPDAKSIEQSSSAITASGTPVTAAAARPTAV